MSGTLFQAPAYDPRRERRRKVVLAIVAVALLAAGGLVWRFRHWSEERIVHGFFQSLQARDYERAYGAWMHDPEWKQHPERHARYAFNEFYRDWGPGGEWGIIKDFQVAGSESPGSSSSGVVVVVTVNQRAERARIWVEKGDRTLTFSPY